MEVPADGAVTVDLVATRAASAAGKVLDASERPVPGATVAWSASPPAGSALYEFGWVAAASRGATAKDGTFAADTLVPGFSYSFHAAAPGETEGTAGPFDADAGKPISAEIRLPKARWLEATVLDEEGARPLCGATVQCCPFCI